MSYYSQQIFSELLRFLLDESGVSVMELVDLVHEKDERYSISKFRLHEYLRGEHIPSFDKAKLILAALDYNISDDELVSILSESRQRAKEEKVYSRSADREITCAARIKYRNILPDLTPEEAEQQFWERLNNIAGGSISKYLQGLIAKDLSEWILSKEEVERID